MYNTDEALPKLDDVVINYTQDAVKNDTQEVMDDASSSTVSEGIFNQGLPIIYDPEPGLGLGIPSFPEFDLLAPITTKIETASERLWLAILSNNVAEIQELMEKEEAGPMTFTEFGGYAVDMAVRMGHVNIVCLFHLSPQYIVDIGPRTLLTAVLYDRKEIMEIMFDIGMREVLAVDWAMMAILYGFTCKYGTPDMLDTLSKHGPEFDWEINWYWCLMGCKDAQNSQKVMELRYEYMDRELDKISLQDAGDLIGDLPETPDVLPLADLMHYYCLQKPYVPIKDYHLGEIIDVAKYIVPSPELDYDTLSDLFDQ